jgi:hypothetical protein
VRRQPSSAASDDSTRSDVTTVRLNMDISR